MSDQPRPAPRNIAFWRQKRRTVLEAQEFSERLERESDALAERIAELEGKLLKLHEVYGEHLYFLRAPSMQDGFRIAAENIKELRAENAKLREALEYIASREGQSAFHVHDMRSAARQALAGKEEG